MTQPRQAIPGSTRLITHSTVMSLFLLMPNKVVTEIMEYCLAYALQKGNVLLHALVVEPSHYHMVLTCLDDRLDEFMQQFHRLVGSCLVRYYKQEFKRRMSCIWDPSRPYGDTLLVNAQAILKHTVYTFTNPVKDGLVSHYRQWPGLHTTPQDWLEGERTVKRPSYYFKNTPEELSYRVTPPPHLGNDVEAVVQQVDEELRVSQKTQREDLRREGRTFLGPRALKKASPFDSPRKLRPAGGIRPAVAAGGDRHAMLDAVYALKRFRLAYRAAWERFKEGLRAVFPGETLMLRRRFRVPCEKSDAAYWCQLMPAPS